MLELKVKDDFVCLFFRDRVSLYCFRAWSGTRSVDQAGLQLTDDFLCKVYNYFKKYLAEGTSNSKSSSDSRIGPACCCFHFHTFRNLFLFSIRKNQENPVILKG
ncbi:hypothetical protein I79_011068 [Cricetulus griseus]|uniref:Uncharacterized protein n=1 Tax=Cricetulus griseus TaxID=10029 RepID=G3HK51_CRIGR|nr:hypothetical protein I79_011068 [Cricetulus griseus]